jgi:hypothetical protein
LKVSIDHGEKESKTYTVKVKRYDSGTPEEFLKWRLILAEQVKNNGYRDNADNIMNLAQAMLAGRSLEAFLNEKRSQEATNRVRKSKTIAEHTPKQIYDFTIFELSIRAFDIQSGWRGAYERQREYMRRDLFMGKLNPEKFSQRLQDLNRYLDFIPIENTSDSLKVTKAYGKSLPEDEIISIMGRGIPPEWTVNMLSLGKEPWKFRDLDDHLNVYRHSVRRISKRKSLPKWLASIHTSQIMERGKIVIRIITIPMADAVVIAMETLLAEDAEGVEEAAAVAAGEETIVSIYRMSNALIVARKVTIPLTVPSRKRTMTDQTWFPKRISKTCFKLQ